MSLLILVLIILIWGALGLSYVYFKNIDEFNFLFLLCILFGLVLEYYVCAIGITTL